MADTKISAMPTAATLSGTEIVPLVQSGGNVQQTLTNTINQTIQAGPSNVRDSLGLGTMAVQDADGVAITGGSINGTVVGNTTPAAVKTSDLTTVGLTGYLYGNNTSPVSTVSVIPTTQGGTNLTSYTLGDTMYASASNTLAKLAGNTTTTQKFLTQTGTGSASAAPIWKVLSPSDINTQYGAFHFDFSTTVSSTVGLNDTTINVVSTSGFSNAGGLIIGAELVTYTGITATSFTGCTRGAAGSSNKSHAVGVSVNGAQIATANTSTLLQINTTDISNGVSVNTSTQEVSVAVGGTYNFAFSAQLNNSATGQTLLAVWFAVDGVNVPNSTSWATIAARENDTTPASTLMAANIFLTLTSSNKVTMKWLSVDGHGTIVTYPASVSPSYPAAPALILTVNQVS
jgi:hypothetical protein